MKKMLFLFWRFLGGPSEIGTPFAICNSSAIFDRMNMMVFLILLIPYLKSSILDFLEIFEFIMPIGPPTERQEKPCL